MNALRRATRSGPAWVSIASFLALSFYLLPHLAYFSCRPILLLSHDAAQSIAASSGAAREHAFKWLMIKNVQGVVFYEETLEDLQKTGRLFVASGEEVLRLFKLQSVVSYYVYEQVRDKNLKPRGSYVFISDASVFDRVWQELKWRLSPDDVSIFERGNFRGDASFPDNFILESSIPPEKLVRIPLGWPVERIRETLASLQAQRAETLSPVLWSEDPAMFSAKPAAALDTALPAAIRLHLPLLRFPYDSIRIVHDPAELISLPRSSDLKSLLSLPVLPANLPLALAILFILAASLRLSQWISWSIAISAALMVAMFALLPSQKIWVLEGVAALLPPAGLFCWMAAADQFRSGQGRPLLGFFTFIKFLGMIVLYLATAGWLLATLIWQYPALALDRYAVYGIMVVPVCSALLFLAVWGIEVANRPIYPRHIRTGTELLLAAGVLFGCTTAWILVLAAAAAWFRWLVLVERTRGRTLEDAPGNYAAFFAASALSLKLFFGSSPLTAALGLAAAFGFGAILSTAWLSRAARPA